MIRFSIFLFLLLPSLAFGAIADVGALLSNCNSTTSSTALSCTTSAQLDQNNVGVFFLATDNQCDTGSGTYSTSENEHQTATIDGNSMTKIYEVCSEIDAAGGADTGATISLWIYRATANLSSGVTVTFNLVNSKTSKAALGEEYSVTSGNTLESAGSEQALVNDSADAGSMTISGLSSQEYLFIRGIGLERDTGGTMTVTTNYASLGVANADTGTGSTSMQARGEYYIKSGATGDSSDPLLSAAPDNDSLYVALKEVSAGGGTHPAPSAILFQ